MEFDYLKFLLATASYAVVCLVLFKILPNSARAIAASFSVFFFFYNAFGVSDANTHISLLPMFIVSILVFLLGVWGGSVLTRPVGVTVLATDHALRNLLGKGRGALVIIFAFVSLNILDLAYPQFRLHLLFNFPELDIRQWFEARLNPEQRGVISYFLILLVPFYYLSLSRYSNNWRVVLFLLFLPLYFGFVKEGYIGRYEIMVKVFIFWLYLWARWPIIRLPLILISAGGVPLLLFAFSVFSFVRLGVSFGDAIYFSQGGAINVLEGEVTFLQATGNRLIESGRNIDLMSYGIWLLTLPLPGFLKAGLPISLINFEISEIVLGLRVADEGFFVLLPGLLAESIFIYSNLFFFHFMFLGVLAGIVSQVVGRAESMFFLHLFFIVSFGLLLNRGGISALAPRVFTEPIFFLVLLLIYIYYRQQVGKGVRR